MHSRLCRQGLKINAQGVALKRLGESTAAPASRSRSEFRKPSNPSLELSMVCTVAVILEPFNALTVHQ